jgi:hypothetical protein
MILVTLVAWVSRVLLGLCAIVFWVMPLVHLRFRLSTWLAQAVTRCKSYRRACCSRIQSPLGTLLSPTPGAGGE